MNAAIWEDASSDDEYFPAEEDVRDDGEEENDGDGLYEYVEEGDEGDEEDEDLEDQHIRAHAAVDYDEEDEEEEEEVVELNIDHVLRQQDPHFLRQIQQALQRTISGRTNATPGGGGGGGGGHNHHISSVSTRSNPARRNHRSRRLLQDIPPIPFPEGKRLINSGEFGAIDDRTHKRRRFEGACTVTQFARYRELGASSKRASTIAITKRWLPKETSGRIVAQYDRHVYSGQFSHDGSFFYTASQDFKCRMYSTPNPAVPHDWTLYKTVRGEIGRWTITDATLSHDNRFLAYSSITPCVYFARTGSTSSMEADAGESWKDGLGPDENQTVLDFSAYSGVGRGAPRYGLDSEREGMDLRTGIWSLRFSADGRELVAGASDQCLYVYDVEMRKITLRLQGHKDDINAVCFADPTSTNVLFSGSDDSLVKVWDRRSMAGGREAGCLPGHMEGITFVATKGDGRYVISNSKDQTLKLWDIRKMIEQSRAPKKYDYCTGFDYRWMDYPGPSHPRHPDDCSITTYSGHRVLKTLIRCHFSPPSSTGQQYLYSGSEDGRIHVWNLDGSIARVIDVGAALSKSYDRSPLDDDDDVEGSSWGSSWGFQSWGMGGRRRGMGGGVSAVVRDVSWHPYEGVLVSSSWTSIAGESGAVTMHAWDGEMAGAV